MQLATLVEVHVTPDFATITAGESRLVIATNAVGSDGVLTAELRGRRRSGNFPTPLRR